MEYNEREQRMWAQSVLADRGYICLKLAGKGAFSRVYCLEDEMDGRIYACKVSEQVKLLEQEAGIMSKLQHPLFTKCFGLWQEAGKGFLLMEYVPGSNVEEMLRRRKRFSVEQALRIGMELAEGLRALHEGQEAFVFRDIKPENMIMGQNGIVKLIDFGCACALGKKAASRAGTPGFAAPEQMQGEGVPTAACDVYGWGQTMKALLGMAESNIILQDVSDNVNRKWAAKKLKKTETAGKAEKEEKREEIGKAAWDSWIGQGDGQGRKVRKQLCHILEACTKGEASERIPDMRGVMAALMPFMSLCVENGDKRNNRKSFYFQKGMVCEKNIIIIQL